MIDETATVEGMYSGALPAFTCVEGHFRPASPDAKDHGMAIPADRGLSRYIFVVPPSVLASFKGLLICTIPFLSHDPVFALSAKHMGAWSSTRAKSSEANCESRQSQMTLPQGAGPHSSSDARQTGRLTRLS
jgi:hypothetical protein